MNSSFDSTPSEAPDSESDSSVSYTHLSPDERRVAVRLVVEEAMTVEFTARVLRCSQPTIARLVSRLTVTGDGREEKPITSLHPSPSEHSNGHTEGRHQEEEEDDRQMGEGQMGAEAQNSGQPQFQDPFGPSIDANAFDGLPVWHYGFSSGDSISKQDLDDIRYMESKKKGLFVGYPPMFRESMISTHPELWMTPRWMIQRRQQCMRRWWQDATFRSLHGLDFFRKHQRAPSPPPARRRSSPRRTELTLAPSRSVESSSFDNAGQTQQIAHWTFHTASIHASHSKYHMQLIHSFRASAMCFSPCLLMCTEAETFRRRQGRRKERKERERREEEWKTRDVRPSKAVKLRPETPQEREEHERKEPRKRSKGSHEKSTFQAVLLSKARGKTE